MIKFALVVPSVVLALATFAACRTDQSSSRALDSEDGTPVTTEGFPLKSTTGLNVVASIEVGGDWMCVGFDSLWEPSGGKLVRVNPETHAIVAKIPASGNFCHAAPNAKIMWVASVFDGKLYRIDATTNEVTGTFAVPISSGSEGSFAVTDSGVWVITNNGGTSSGTLSRVDPTTGQVVADIPVAADSHGIAAAGAFVWVSSSAGNSVTQVDPRTNIVVATIPVDKGPRFIAGGEGGVWALCQGTGTVAHIDAETGALVGHIDTKTPGGGGDIAVGEGYVWVTTFGRPVTRIDPKYGKVLEQFQGSGFGDAIRAGVGYVWVSGGHLSQIKPAAIVAP